MHRMYFVGIISILLLIHIQLACGVAQISGQSLHPYGKTRLHHSTADNSSENLISINLNTSSIDEARQILLQHDLELVSRDGSLDYWYLAKQNSSPTRRRNTMEELRDGLDEDDRVLFYENAIFPETKLTSLPSINDPLFPLQWNLWENPSSPAQAPVVAGADINILPAWELGYNGSDIHIQFIDGGLDLNHLEFSGRVRLSSSWNFATGAANPYVREVSHGTSCAGIAAGSMGNSLCGAGIAYGARVSGVVAVGISGVSLSTALTATSMTVNVSSNSWGLVFGLGNYVQVPQSIFDAFFTLANRGVITVFSSGNEGLFHGSCSYGEMISDSHIIVVAATNQYGKKSSYSSECSSVFVSAPGGDHDGKSTPNLRISTAENDGRCASDFKGTSASCPMISGVVALMKQATRSLKVRDVQHILTRTSRMVDATDSSWQQNSVGVWHSNKYGFGLVDAYKAVLMAAMWNRLPEAKYASFVQNNVFIIPDGTGASLERTLRVTLPASALIEHVAVFIDANHAAPNQLRAIITSPSRTVSVLTEPFLTTPAYRMEGYNNMIAFASPYWSTASFPTGWQFAGNVQVGDTCDVYQIQQPAEPNLALLFYSLYPDGYCPNTFEIINRAKSMGYSGILFFGYSNFVDWKTQTKLDFPSFYIPIWQSEQLSYTPAFSRIDGDYKAPSTLAGGFMFGSWKFFNETPAGDWTLSLQDTVRGTSGTLQSWSIQLRYALYETPPINPPTTVPGPTVAPIDPPREEQDAPLNPNTPVMLDSPTSDDTNLPSPDDAVISPPAIPDSDQPPTDDSPGNSQPSPVIDVPGTTFEPESGIDDEESPSASDPAPPAGEEIPSIESPIDMNENPSGNNDPGDPSPSADSAGPPTATILSSLASERYSTFSFMFTLAILLVLASCRL